MSLENIFPILLTAQIVCLFFYKKTGKSLYWYVFFGCSVAYFLCFIPLGVLAVDWRDPFSSIGIVLHGLVFLPNVILAIIGCALSSKSMDNVKPLSKEELMVEIKGIETHSATAKYNYSISKYFKIILAISGVLSLIIYLLIVLH